MDVLGVSALSSSQLLVVFALGLFATIIFSSIYIRIRGQYRGRNKLPDHTRQNRGFKGRRARDSHLPSIPTDNHEVVSGARPKKQIKDDTEGFQFDFDIPARPSGPIEHVASDPQEEIRPFDPLETPAEVGAREDAESIGNGTDKTEYEERFEDESVAVSDDAYQQFEEAITNGVDEDADYEADVEQMADTWDANDDEGFYSDNAEEITGNEDAYDEASNSEFSEEEYSVSDHEYVDEVVSSANEYDDVPANEEPAYDDAVAANLDEQVAEQPSEPDVDEIVVPFDRRTDEVKRVGVPQQDVVRSFSVVSVCLISDDEGQIYRDIRGEHLAAFLNKRGFIYLDEEYHLQQKSTVEKGAIRVRNYEATQIGAVVKGNRETCGFRLYFRPGDCADPLATMNEMLKIANVAIGYFSDVCAKPLVIYDGRKDSTGNISPLTQEDYDTLKRDLASAFPRSLDITSKRTAVTRNEYAPSEDLPTRAEQY